MANTSISTKGIAIWFRVCCKLPLLILSILFGTVDGLMETITESGGGKSAFGYPWLRPQPSYLHDHAGAASTSLHLG